MSGRIQDAIILMVLAATTITTQEMSAQVAGRPVAQLVADPPSLTLVVGETAAVTVRALDGSGTAFAAALRAAGRTGAVQARIVEGGLPGSILAEAPGEYEVVVTAVEAPGAGQPARVTIPVLVRWPDISEIDVTPVDDIGAYAGTVLRFRALATHADGSTRPGVDISWVSSNSSIATVDRFGTVSALTSGTVSLSAQAESTTGQYTLTVVPFPAATLIIEAGPEQIRTGDVVEFQAVAADESGAMIDDLAMTWSYTFVPTTE